MMPFEYFRIQRKPYKILTLLKKKILFLLMFSLVTILDCVNSQNSESKPLCLSIPYQGYWFDKREKSGIYIIYCKSTEKYYIGASKNVVVRFNAHKSQLRRGIHFCQALQSDYNSYGVNSFIFEKILMGSGLKDLKKLNDLETAILQTFPPESLYNKYVDWYSRPGELNNFYGKQHSTQSREALSNSKRGKPSSFKGHSQSNDVRNQISEQNRGMSSMERRKGLYIGDTYYVSVSQASQLTGDSRRIIRERCHSTKPQFAHYIWASNNGDVYNNGENAKLFTEDAFGE
jgi:group I intron endonuclease